MQFPNKTVNPMRTGTVSVCSLLQSKNLVAATQQVLNKLISLNQYIYAHNTYQIISGQGEDTGDMENIAAIIFIVNSFGANGNCDNVLKNVPPEYSYGFPGGSGESVCQCKRHRRPWFNPWVRKIPWRRTWQPTLLFFPGKSHGQRSLVGYSPRGHKESDTSEHTKDIYILIPESCECHFIQQSINKEKREQVFRED